MALAWVFGVGAGLTLVSTPVVVAAGWLTRDLLVRLQSEGLTLPVWYVGLVTALFALLVLIHLGLGVVSLVAARAFWRLRRWAWRWFNGLLLTSLTGLVLLLLFAAVVAMVVVPRLQSMAGGATTLPPGLTLASGFGVVTGVGAMLFSAVPAVVLLWLLRMTSVRLAFEPEGGDREATRRASDKDVI